MWKAIAIVCVLGGAAHAEGDVSLSMGSDIRALHSESANALTGDSLVGGNVRAAYRLPLDVIPNLTVSAELGFVGSSAQGTLFNSLNTSVSLRELTAGVQARYRVFRRVVAFGRADFGGARDYVSITSQQNAMASESDHAWGAVASDHAWGAVASGALGVELMAIDGGADASRWDIGLRLEFGYAQASKIALSPTPQHPDDDTLRLPMMEASLGHLDLSGPTFSGGIVGHF